MTLTIQRADLARTLAAVSKVVESRNTIPILANVLLQAADGKLTVTGTDLDISYAASTPAEGTLETTVDAKRLSDIARRHENIQGRTLRLFETGNIEEDRWIENLRSIGCEVVDRGPDGKQIMVEACDGHVRGYLDSEILGLPEAPKTIHVGEMKSHNLKSFTDLKKRGVRLSKPLHYGQIQTYMHQRGRDRGIYLAVCKDNDELYAERLDLDLPYVTRLLARAERIVKAHEPPAKLHEDPSASGCRR